MGAKHEVAALLGRLPDCSLEDIQYHLYVLEKIHAGLADSDAGRVLTQDEAEARLRQWLTE